MFALDIETAPIDSTPNPYALEPFRVKQNKAKITSIALAGSNGFLKQITNMEELPSLLSFLKHQEVFAHYAVFDIAWMFATSDNFELIKNIEWRDTALLAKWILNSQITMYGDSNDQESKGRFSYSLINLATIYLKDHPRIEEFIGMKNEDKIAGEDEKYWLERGCLDAIMTLALAEKLKEKMPTDQLRGFLVEQKILPYVARSWVQGIPFNREYFDRLRPKIKKAQEILSKDLSLNAAVIRSPTQLGNYLFNTLGMQPINITKTGKGSTAAGDLKLLALNYANTDVGKQLLKILQFKKLATLESKYVNGFQDVYDYVGESVCYASPKIFGTYTGRFTYSSKSQKKEKSKVSIALHQIPREGPVKKGLIAFPGRALALNDAAQQELRLVGQCSQDQHLINGFNSGIDMHSFMSAFIAGEAYESFCERLENKEKDAINYRYAGKLLNLSCQYRIGANSLKKKFFDTYDIIIDQRQAQMYLKYYKRCYPDVVEYWSDSIVLAREKGYAETLGGRRYGITEWAANKWASESSAINTPIQGSAADHKEATLWKVSEKFPEINFMLDIHDELIFDIPNDEELCKEILYFTNQIDYSAIWNKKLNLKLPFDSQFGFNFSEKRSI